MPGIRQRLERFGVQHPRSTPRWRVESLRLALRVGVHCAFVGNDFDTAAIRIAVVSLKIILREY